MMKRLDWIATVPVFFLLSSTCLMSGDVQRNQPQSNNEAKNAVFKREAGFWETQISTWPNGNLAPPTIFKAVQRNTLSSDGLTISRMYKSDEKLNFPDRITGHGMVLEYDSKTRRYIGRWPKKKNDEEAIGKLEGTYDEESNTLTMLYYPLKSKNRFPLPRDKDGSPLPVEEHVTKYIDANTKKYSVRLLQPDANGKVWKFTAFEMVAKRKME